MDTRLVGLADLLKWNTLLFRNCLDGVSPEQSFMRPTPKTNHLAFVAAHVTDSRYNLLKVLGAQRPSPMQQYIGKARALDEIERWPTLTETLDAWTKAGHALRDRLDSLTTADVAAPMDPPFLGPDKTRLDGLSFLAQHESYHIGQLSLLRTFVGLPAMRYS